MDCWWDFSDASFRPPPRRAYFLALTTLSFYFRPQLFTLFCNTFTVLAFFPFQLRAFLQELCGSQAPSFPSSYWPPFQPSQYPFQNTRAIFSYRNPLVPIILCKCPRPCNTAYHVIDERTVNAVTGPTPIGLLAPALPRSSEPKQLKELSMLETFRYLYMHWMALPKSKGYMKSYFQQ